MRALSFARVLAHFLSCVACISGCSGSTSDNGSGGAASTGNQPTAGATSGSAGVGPSSAGGNGGAPSAGGGFSNGGSSGATSGASTGGASGGATNAGSGGGGGNPNSDLGKGMMVGSGRSDEQYATGLVSRSGTPYVLITNGWGPGFGSHAISWEGTSFIVETMSGTSGSMGQPASYPTVFCGKYSVMEVPDCGLPATRDSITSLRTGWRWRANGNVGEYNAAYDIWVGNGTQLLGYLMVWLRDPPRNRPAGQLNAAHQNITVANVPGTWNIWDGSVNNLPIINWVRAQDSDSEEIEFDVMDFVRDAQMRGLNIPGTHINSVAVGFEIWEGPITNLESVDFYVDVN